MAPIKRYSQLVPGDTVTWRDPMGGNGCSRLPEMGTETVILTAETYTRYNSHDRCPYPDDLGAECWEEGCPHGSTIIEHQLVSVKGHGGKVSSGWFADAEII